MSAPSADFMLAPEDPSIKVSAPSVSHVSATTDGSDSRDGSVSAPTDGANGPPAPPTSLASSRNPAIPLAPSKKTCWRPRSQAEKASQALGKKHRKEDDSRKPTPFGRKRLFPSQSSQISSGKQQLLSRFFKSLNMPGAEESTGSGLVRLALAESKQEVDMD